MRKGLKHIILLVFLFGLLVAFEYIKPKPVDWSFDFRADSKKPNGCYVYSKILRKVLPEDSVLTNTRHIPEYISGDSLQGNKSILFITDRFDADSLVAEKLISFADSGGKVFISALSINGFLKDTLGFEVFMAPFTGINKDCAFQLNFPQGDSDKYYHFRQLQHSYFDSFDSLNSCVMGTDSFSNAVLLSVRVGKGSFLIQLAPEVFSNNQLLYGNRDYAMKVTSYFQHEVMIWDEFHKPGGYTDGEPTTPMRFMLGNANLRSAYVIFLIAVFILFVLGSKRRQRIIPVILEPVNASLEFIRIISGLYLGSADHLKMAEKKFTFFTDYIRSHYFLNSIQEGDEFFTWLSSKSGAEANHIRSIFAEISRFRSTGKVNEMEFVVFVKRIDDFYKTAEKASHSFNRQ
jgi:hypothetical protein